jgi:hypothetical protein
MPISSRFDYGLFIKHAKSTRNYNPLILLQAILPNKRIGCILILENGQKIIRIILTYIPQSA